jgi:hypothetical protein
VYSRLGKTSILFPALLSTQLFIQTLQSPVLGQAPPCSGGASTIQTDVVGFNSSFVGSTNSNGFADSGNVNPGISHHTPTHHADAKHIWFQGTASTDIYSKPNIIQGNPSNYLSLLSTLKPGDIFLLEPGIYARNGLPVFNLNGTPSNPIIITGPDEGPLPQILGHAYQNTVRIGESSYVIIRNLEINPRNRGGDGINAQGISHHITLENLYIHGFSDDQGTVGISTNRSPVWNWTIRNNVVTDGGTGMYLGNSPGTEPFVNGIIENNFIADTIGYNIQIKHQISRPDIPGMPIGTSRTIIRNNVFSKATQQEISNQFRPNLLVGHFPLSGPGKDDVYEIYGNFFYQNPQEALLQGEGNVAVYSNINSCKSIDTRSHLLRTASQRDQRTSGSDRWISEWTSGSRTVRP